MDLSTIEESAMMCSSLDLQAMYVNWLEYRLDDPDTPQHFDLRSPSVPRKRRRKELTKYYGYRAVKPSWVGKQYYTIKLVSSEVHTLQLQTKNLPKRNKEPIPHITHVIEKDEDLLLSRLVISSWRWWPFSQWGITDQITLAVAQARASDLSLYPEVIRNTSSNTITTTTTTTNNSTTELSFAQDPSTDLSRYPIHPPGRFPKTMPRLWSSGPLKPGETPIPAPPSLALKLRTQTWSKQDNFKNATNYFNGPDRRHHRGKRACREKRMEKENERRLLRGKKNAAVTVRNYLPWSFHEYNRNLWVRFQGEMHEPDVTDELGFCCCCERCSPWQGDEYELRDGKGETWADGQVGTEQDYWDYDCYFKIIDKVRLAAAGLDENGEPFVESEEVKVEDEVESTDGENSDVDVDIETLSSLGSDVVILQHDQLDAWSDVGCDEELDFEADFVLFERVDGEAFVDDEDWDMLLVDEWTPLGYPAG